MKTHLLLLIMSVLSATPVLRAQTCEELVAHGRSLIVASNLHEADRQFSAAIAQCAQDPAARTLRAITSLALLPHQPGISQLLDRLGVPSAGRTLYNWTAELPRTTNGNFILPTDFDSREFVTLLQGEVLARVLSAALDLSYVMDTNFLLSLSYEETKSADVTLDYGDVLMLRALLHAAEFWIQSVASWNLSANLHILDDLERAGYLSVETVFRMYPNLLTFASTNNLIAAKEAFLSAVQRYNEGSAFIRARPANLIRLFNYDLEKRETESQFRCTLADMVRSLGTPTVLCVDSNYVLYFGAFFTGQNPPANWRPHIIGNQIAAATWPDLSFGGIVGGLTEPVFEGFVSDFARLSPMMRSPEPAGQGRFSCEFTTLANRVYALQYSTDLRSWSELVRFYAEGGSYGFLDSGARQSPMRFYRLVELYEYSFVRGEVRDLCSGAPIPNARVQLGEAESVTDQEGRFSLRITSQFGRDDLLALADGYYGQSAYFWDEDDNNQIFLRPLIPPAPPANDQFSGRMALTGWPDAVRATSCAAGQGGVDDLDWWYNTVWFSWTAPTTGYVRAVADAPFGAVAISAFTGSSVANLVDVPGSVNYSDFEWFAIAGETYHILVGGFYSSHDGSFSFSISGRPLPQIQSPTLLTYTAPASIFFDISVSDTDGDVEGVTIKANGRLIAEFTARPYTYTWPNVPTGLYSITVRARDQRGNIGEETRQIAVRPPNDAFANAIAISGAPLTVRGLNRAASRENGEPSHDESSDAQGSVWWRWTTPYSGPVSIVLEGASHSDVLAVYTGASLSTLASVATGIGSSALENPTVTFTATAFTEYHVAVASTYTSYYWYGGNRGGEVRFQIVPTAAPTVTILSPLDGALLFGPTNITVQVQASDPDGTIASTSLYLDGRLLNSMAGPALQYTWTNVTAGTYRLQARATDNLGVTALSTQTVINVRPINDNFANRIQITTLPAELRSSTLGATREAGEPTWVFPYDNTTVWWTFTPTVSASIGMLDISQPESPWSKRVIVFTGTSISGLTQVRSFTSYFGDYVTFNASAGTQYQIMVQGYYGETGEVLLRLE